MQSAKPAERLSSSLITVITTVLEMQRMSGYYPASGLSGHFPYKVYQVLNMYGEKIILKFANLFNTR